MLKALTILKHHGPQYIPDVTAAVVPSPFRGRPIISKVPVNAAKLGALCPTGAIETDPVSINLGKCLFCGECAFRYPEKIAFTNDFKTATNDPEELIIREGNSEPLRINPRLIREEIKPLFSKSLKLRQISAGGDNSAELELNACSNANFDMGRFGLEFVASPRHADGIVLTGPLSENMAEAAEICLRAIPQPRLVILAGTDAISGGLFRNAGALQRQLIERIPVDLYLPGNPPHPLTIVNGLLSLTRYAL